MSGHFKHREYAQGMHNTQTRRAGFERVAQIKKNTATHNQRSMSARQFWLIDADCATIQAEFASKTARDAALKAATRGHSLILLAEPEQGKIHVFKGWRKPLSDKEMTDFTQRNKITSKPYASKLAYKNLGRPLMRQDINDVSAHMLDMIS